MQLQRTRLTKEEKQRKKTNRKHFQNIIIIKQKIRRGCKHLRQFQLSHSERTLSRIRNTKTPYSSRLGNIDEYFDIVLLIKKSVN